MSGHYDVANAEKTGCCKVFSYYLVGFIVCILLTLLAYFMVQRHILMGTDLVVVLSAIAIIQLIVQMVCFVRLNTGSSDAKLDLISFIFTLLVVVVVVCGTLWIMFNLNYNMVR